MDFQTGFNLLFGLLSGVLGWLLNNLWGIVRDLNLADKELITKVQAIEVLVAGQYIKRSEFEAKIDALFHKLDGIEDKLDRRFSSGSTQQ